MPENPSPAVGFQLSLTLIQGFCHKQRFKKELLTPEGQ